MVILFSSNTYTQNSDELAIRKILKNQVAEWNKGNIDNFMKGYWNSDSVMFVGKNGPVHGYTNTLNNYKKSYPDTTIMGKLHFIDLSLQKLSADYYFVIGKFLLTRTIGNTKGVFTLLFRKIKGEWVIIADHSS